MFRMKKKAEQILHENPSMTKDLLPIYLLEDLFCLDIHSDQTKYKGLRILEWIKLYNKLRSLKENEVIFKKQDLIDKIKCKLYDQKIVTIFIDEISFSKESPDIFDSPIILLENDLVYFNSTSFNTNNIFFIMLSFISKKKIIPKDKGERFEKRTISDLKEHFKKTDTLKFKGIDNQEYQFDAISITKNKIFIFECKNNSMLLSNPKRTFDYMKENLKNIEQIKRLKEGILNNPKHIEKKFNIKIKDYKIIPVIINNTPFSWLGMVDNVYCTDSSSLRRFISNRNIYETSGKNKKIVMRQWENENSPTGNDLIRHFEDGIRLKAPLSSFEANDIPIYTGNAESMTFVRCFYINDELERKYESDFFKRKSRNLKKGYAKKNR